MHAPGNGAYTHTRTQHTAYPHIARGSLSEHTMVSSTASSTESSVG